MAPLPAPDRLRQDIFGHIHQIERGHGPDRAPGQILELAVSRQSAGHARAVADRVCRLTREVGRRINEQALASRFALGA